MRISVVMIDGGFRENCFGAKYFAEQDFDSFEVIWVEFYRQANAYVTGVPGVKVVCLGSAAETEYHSSHCFNEGIRQAQGEVLVIPDADQVVDRDFLSKVWAEHQACDDLACYYYRYDEPRQGQLASLELAELDAKCVLKNPVNYGGCLTVRRKWLLAVNGYEMHPVFGSGFHANGLDMYTRFKNLGLSVKWSRKAKLFHPWHPFTLANAPQYERQKAVIAYRRSKLDCMALQGLDSERDTLEDSSPELLAVLNGTQGSRTPRKILAGLYRKIRPALT